LNKIKQLDEEKDFDRDIKLTLE